jgi:hypothetical protein
MATRSTIAMEFADGTVQQVYCHWDGYLSNNGQILFENYKDPFKLRELIDLGDISSLGPNIGEKHDFDIAFKYGSPEYEAEAERRRGITTFYGRDRGETGTSARKFADYADYRKNAQFEEYNYILRRDGKWYVEFYGEFDGLLQEAIEQRNAEEAA